MKPSKSMFEETMKMLSKNGYRIVYVPHTIIEDYNATYNVMCEGRHVVADAAKKLGIPLGEIWISELWKPYERFIVFHELREIRYRAEGRLGMKLMKERGRMGSHCGVMIRCGFRWLLILRRWIGELGREREERGPFIEHKALVFRRGNLRF